MGVERKPEGKIQLGRPPVSNRLYELRFKPPVDPDFKEALVTIQAFNRGETVATDVDLQNIIDSHARRFLKLRDRDKLTPEYADWGGRHTEDIVRVAPKNYYDFDFFVDFG